MGFSSGTSTKWLFVHCFQIELEFGNVGFCGGRKTGEDPAKNPRSRDENQQQTQPTYGICSWDTNPGRCAIPAPH